MVKKAIIVVTSTERYPNTEKPTGLWLSEATHFYQVMKHAGIEVDIVSTRGGYVPIDPVSLQTGMTEIDWHYYADQHFRTQLGHSLKPTDVDPENYNIIYFAGGHGTMFDFPDNVPLQHLAREIYEHGGVVAAVCHGTAALLNLFLGNGIHLIKGKKVSGFSNDEEEEIKLKDAMPYLLEDEIWKRGGHYCKGQSWKEFVVSDHRVVTGQNPSSSAEVGREVLKVLGSGEHQKQ